MPSSDVSEFYSPLGFWTLRHPSRGEHGSLTSIREAHKFPRLVLSLQKAVMIIQNPAILADKLDSSP